MLRNNRKILIIISILLFLLLIPVKTFAKELTEIKIASSIIDPGNFEPPALKDKDTAVFINKASTIVFVIRTIGIVVTVVCLMLIGIKYMTSSIEEKAEYKKSMIPYLVGVFIFFALTQLLGVIIKVTQSISDKI